LQNVRSNNIVKAAMEGWAASRTAIQTYLWLRARSHPLQAGGAMALFIIEHDVMTVQQAQRLTSNTFM